MLQDRFKTAFDVHHLGSEVSSKRTFNASADISSTGLFLPTQAEDVALLDGAYSETSILLCPVLAIVIGDKIVSGGETYYVGGKRIYDDFDNNHPHLRLTIYKPQ